MGYGRRRAAVSLLTLWCGVSAGLDAQQVIEYTNNFQYLRGQSVQPVFEGWSKLPDGGFTMHFGYLNRNWVERPIIPVGPTNQVTPGGPDRGQPSFFYNRVQRSVFTVTVPKNWGPKAEVVWTLTHNGKTERAVGWLQPEWLIEPFGGASGGGRTDPERAKNQPPTIAIDPVQPLRLGSASGESPASVTVTLSTTTSDDGLPRPAGGGRGRGRGATGQDSPSVTRGGTTPPVNVPELYTYDTPGGPPITAPRPKVPRPAGLAVSWMVWRGPADVLFDPVWSQPKDGRTATTATFTKPGDYVLRATAGDGQLSKADSVTVVVAGSTANQP